jgi:REP element-mobilizing transposase RayT
MARPTRIDFPGALFHVIARGNQRQAIFRDQTDFSRYEALLQRYHQRHGFRLYAYVLMPTHVHLLVETGRLPLAKSMQGLQQSYTAYFNSRYRLVGHCFHGRYKAILYDQDSYLLTLVRYLHLNPVRAALVTDPREWAWSSHNAYRSPQSCSWVASDRILAQFGSDRRRAVAAYLRFVRNGYDQGHRDELYDLVEQRYLGDERFVETCERKAGKVARFRRLSFSVEDCLAMVSEHLGVERDSLPTASRGGQLPLARALAAFLGRELAGIPLAETARALNRAPVTLSLQAQRLAARRECDPDFARLVAKAEEYARNKVIKA